MDLAERGRRCVLRAEMLVRRFALPTPMANIYVSVIMKQKMKSAVVV